mmetsp:Transcript_5649/g.17877  ORF Transcript_5649/g.17877 Transcript_5649/m.17877 type:complete len:828 (+) Transcript_5649:1614-4097(+)
MSRWKVRERSRRSVCSASMPSLQAASSARLSASCRRTDRRKWRTVWRASVKRSLWSDQSEGTSFSVKWKCSVSTHSKPTSPSAAKSSASPRRPSRAARTKLVFVVRSTACARRETPSTAYTASDATTTSNFCSGTCSGKSSSSQSSRATLKQFTSFRAAFARSRRSTRRDESVATISWNHHDDDDDDDGVGKNNNNDNSQSKPLLDWFDEDEVDPRPRRFTVAIDDLTSGDARVAEWGKYSWDTGYWTVDRARLEVLWDGVELYLEREENGKIGAAAEAALSAELADVTARATEVERQGFRQTIEDARKQLEAFEPTDLWATFDLSAEDDSATLRRLALKARGAVRAKRREVKELRDSVAKLVTKVGADRGSGRSTQRHSGNDPTSIRRLRAEEACLRRDLAARRRLFASYVDDLAAHVEASGGEPSELWARDRQASRSSTDKHLDAALFRRLQGLPGVPWFAAGDDDALASRRHREEEEEEDSESSFAFPFGALSLREEDTAAKADGEPPRYDDEFFNVIRERYLWWLVTWVDVRDCVLCYGATPKADLMGGQSQDGPICAHVAGTCSTCMKDYVRFALSDTSAVTERGLPCVSEVSTGCEACYQPQWLAKRLTLTSDEVTRLERFVRAARIRGGDKGWCPNADCDTVVDFSPLASAGPIRCPTCALELCPKCRQAAHAGDCQAQFGVANLALANQKKFQSCPKCHAIVEKSEACDHMSCRCGARFCYVCGAEGHSCPTTCTKPRRFNGASTLGVGATAADDRTASVKRPAPPRSPPSPPPPEEAPTTTTPPRHSRPPDDDLDEDDDDEDESDDDSDYDSDDDHDY